jgi:colanic acid biosynthesis glycosyl transferase WcaI
MFAQNEKEVKKKITIIGINYYPEDTAIGLYTSQLAEYYKEQNFEVNVIAGFPYYPLWKIHSEYTSKNMFFKENINGINVFRYKQYVPKNPTFIKRILHLLDFSFGTFINIFKVKETDVVLCIVPFTSTILLGKILARIKKAKLWVHIQDFEFDAVMDSDIVDNKINKSIFFKLLFWIERKLLNSASIITTISTSMILKLDKKIKSDKKRKLLPNWVDLNFINPSKYKVHQYLKSTKFKILYSGNIGEKQDWDFFLKFVKEFESNPLVEIIVVGDGSKRDWLEQKLKNTKNVFFYSPVPYIELSDLLCSADLHVLFQKTNVVDTVMPSKILAMMGSQKPSLITGSLESEVFTIMNQSKAGGYYDAKNINDILSLVKQIMEDKTLSEKYGKNARNYVSLNFSKKEVLEKFKTTFINLID